MTLDDACKRLRAEKGSIRCADVVSILEALGFVVKARSRGNHHTYVHPGVKEFHGSNFACPHRSGDPVDKSYITNILRVIRQHEEAIGIYLGAKQ